MKRNIDNKTKTGADFKPIQDMYGVHVRVFLKELLEVEHDNDTLELKTNSISLGKRIAENYTEEDLVELFMSIFREEWFKDYVMDLAGLDSRQTNPVWCKQLGRHFA